MAGDLVTERSRVSFRVRHLLELHTAVQLVPLAGLDEEELGFAGQAGTALGVEVGPHPVRLERLVGGVEDPHLTCGRNTKNNVICSPMTKYSLMKNNL